MRRTFFLLASRLALLAALLGALTPTISYGVSAARGEHVIEICTAMGAKRIVVNAEGQPTGKTSEAGLHGHCNYCLPGQDAQLLATVAVVDFTPPQVLTPPALGSGSRHLPLFHSWHSPPAQAPPLA
ncbi:hypothetical protein DLREEDagrD3_01060 [Denitratisoma sp. agr-D3]